MKGSHTSEEMKCAATHQRMEKKRSFFFLKWIFIEQGARYFWHVAEFFSCVRVHEQV